MMRIKVFTDGACSGNPGAGGYAATISYPDNKKTISGGLPSTTNNQMELMAVIEALKDVLDSDYDFKSVDIYSDSAYVINAVNKKWLKRWSSNGWQTAAGKDIKNKSFWIELLDILSDCKDKKINFIKVKGHSKNPMNDLVDKLAKDEVKKFTGK
jgi:ribonuclease HI